MTAAVRSGDPISTCSASMSFLTHSMLWIAHLPSLHVDGTIFVHFWCPIGVVNSWLLILLAWGSWIAIAAVSWISLLFIRLSCTALCFLTFSWIIWSVLFMLHWIQLLIVSAVWFMWASAQNALKDCLIADAVVVAFLSIFHTLLGVLALECLMSDLLAVVALCWLWLMFKGVDYARFSSSMEEPLGQEPLCIGAFSQVHHYWPIGLCTFLSAEPCNLGNSGFILLAEGCCSSCSDLTLFI